MQTSLQIIYCEHNRFNVLKLIKNKTNKNSNLPQYIAKGTKFQTLIIHHKTLKFDTYSEF